MIYVITSDEFAKLFVENFQDSINVMLLDNKNKPAWYEYLRIGQDRFKTLFLPLLLNRDKSKDPKGLTPLHFAYLYRNQVNRDFVVAGITGECILESLLNIPELVELDGLQRDKFQSLPHQVTPIPRRSRRLSYWF